MIAMHTPMPSTTAYYDGIRRRRAQTAHAFEVTMLLK